MSKDVICMCEEKSSKNSKGDEDMATNTIENVKEPVERLKNSLDEYYRAKKTGKQLMTFEEMMRRLEEDDE